MENKVIYGMSSTRDKKNLSGGINEKFEKLEINNNEYNSGNYNFYSSLNNNKEDYLYKQYKNNMLNSLNSKNNKEIIGSNSKKGENENNIIDITVPVK